MNDLDKQIDELANPDYPKRFSQCYEPSKNLSQAVAAVDSKGWTWTLSSRGLASVWLEVNGENKQARAEAETPQLAMCKAFIKACEVSDE